MDIRQPPQIGSDATPEEVARWAEELYSWAYDLYEWIKFPHFHQLGLVGAVTYTSSCTLTDADMCRLIKMSSSGTLAARLPSATTARLGYYVCIERAGSGDLIVRADGTDTIGPSTAGGFLESDETRDYPRI